MLPHPDRIGGVPAAIALSRIDVVTFLPSVSGAGDERLPADVQHHGGWIVHRPAVVADREMPDGETPGRQRKRVNFLGRHGIDVLLERMDGSGAPLIRLVTAPVESGDSKQRRATSLRHCQALEFKGL